MVCALQDGFVGTVEIVNVHQHTVGSAASLAFFRPSSHVRQQFKAYFDSGLGISDAMRHHADNMTLEDGIDESRLADGSVNPQYSTVRCWFDQWRLINLGPRTGEHLLDVCNSCFAA